MKQIINALIVITICLSVGNIQAKDLMINAGNTNNYSYLPHKGAFLLGAEFLTGDRIDDGFKNTIIAENNYLESLGLTWNTMDESGKIISTDDINKYFYSGEDITVGIRLLYFTSDALAIGVRFGNYSYTQMLTIDKKDELGTMMEFNLIGPSINWYVYKKKRIGLLLKGDVSFVIGKEESIPALNLLISDSYFNGKLPDELAGIVKNKHNTTSFNGFQYNAGISVNYFITNWINIDAGFQINSFSGNFKEILWTGTEKTIKSVTPGINFSVNFLLMNKHDD
jgi:hypothetical protein